MGKRANDAHNEGLICVRMREQLSVDGVCNEGLVLLLEQSTSNEKTCKSVDSACNEGLVLLLE
jgi:hypothetical protein